jgi:hypothetical protein
MVELDGEKVYWRQVEEWVCEKEEWEDVDESTHDALTCDGKRVEIKCCDLDQGKRVTIWDEQRDRSDYIAIVSHKSGKLHRYMIFESGLLNDMMSTMTKKYDYYMIHIYVEYADYDVLRDLELF